jgi:hypothetical protein
MNRRFPISYRPVVLTALVLLCGSLAPLPAGAQTAAPATDKPVTLNLENVPVQTALRSLFRSAGISNYALDTPARGFVNMQVSDVPFSIALRQLLRSAQPALDFTLDNGAYHITSKAAAAVVNGPVSTASAHSTRISGAETGGSGGAADQARRFYPIRVNKYDAFVIASLLGSAGIVDVPTNITRGSNGGQQGGFGGQQGGFGGQQGGFGGQQGGFGGQRSGFGGGQQSGFGGGGGRRRGGGGYGG